MKIPFLRTPPRPEAETILAKYRTAIGKKRGLLPALVWGENDEANRELLDEVARSIDKGLLHEREYSAALLRTDISLRRVSRRIEGILLERAKARDAAPNPDPTNGAHGRTGARAFGDAAKQAVNQFFCCPVVHAAPPHHHHPVVHAAPPLMHLPVMHSAPPSPVHVYQQGYPPLPTRRSTVS